MNEILSTLAQLGGAVGVAGIVLGIIECFFGYRIFKVLVAIAGFIVGAALGSALASSSSQLQAVVWLAALAGGIIFALLAFTLYAIGVFLIGALAGVVLAYVLFGVIHSSPQPIAILIVALIVGVLAVVFQKFMIIVLTAFGGAWSAVSGLASLTTAAVSPLAPQGLSGLPAGTLWAIVLGWLALGLVGAIVQYRVGAHKTA